MEKNPFQRMLASLTQSQNGNPRKKALAFMALFSLPLSGATINVTTSVDTYPSPTPGSLREALLTWNDGDTIDCSAIVGGTITLAGPLPGIIHSGIINTGTIQGNPVTIDGLGGGSVPTYHAFSIGQGTLTLSNFVIQNCLNKGGDGGICGVDGANNGASGGGGAGGGGGVYIADGIGGTVLDVTLDNVQILNCKAQGGAGGSFVLLTVQEAATGGGGGFGGGSGGDQLDPTSVFSAGGGGNSGGGNGGAFAAGEDGEYFGGAGGGGSSFAGGDTTPPGLTARTGGLAASDGGGGGAGIIANGDDATSSSAGNGGLGLANGFGGGGGAAASASDNAAGSGSGTGGGGGAALTSAGSSNADGGSAGGGGGGVTGSFGVGGTGGFGAGGGGGGLTGGTSDTSNSGGGGMGGAGTRAGGGGGAAMGGGIYLGTNASLTLGDNSPFGLAGTGSSTVVAGLGGSISATSAGNAGTASGSDIFMRSGATLKLTNTFPLTFIKDIASNTHPLQINAGGGLYSIGSGTVNLSGANSFTGSVTLQGANVVAILSDASLGHVANVVFIGPATLQALGTVTSARHYTLTAAATFDSNAQAMSISGSITGTGNLVKTGIGSLTLSGTNTYTGGTTIQAGVLALTKPSAIDSGSALIINGGTFNIQNSSGTCTIGDLSGAGDVFLGSDALVVGTTGSSTFSGQILGTGGLTKQNSGTLTLSGSNVYGGTTTISGGTLALSGSGGLPIGSSVVNDGIFSINASASNQAIGDLSGAGLVILGSNSLTLGSINNTTFSGSISGSGGLTKQNSGIFTLSGTNTYTGITDIAQGTLALSGAGALSPSGTISVTATFDLSNAANTIIGDLTGTGSVILGANSLRAGTSGSSIFAGSISGIGSFEKANAGTLTLTGSNSYTGGTTILDGTLALSGSGSLANGTAVAAIGVFDIQLATSSVVIGDLTGTGTVMLGSGTLAVGKANSSATFSGSITGNGFLTKQTSGTLSLSGVSNYSGRTTITGGVLALFGSGALLSSAPLLNDATFDISASSGSVTIGDLTGAGTINLGSQTLIVQPTSESSTYNGIVIGNGTLIKQGANALILMGANTYSGGTTISAGALQGNTLSLQGLITNNSSLVFNQTQSGTFTGTISGSGSLTKQGSASLSLLGTHTYTGSTHLDDGTLIINTGSSLGTGTLNIGSATLQAVNTLTLAASRALDLSGNAVFDTQAGQVTVDSIVNGVGELIKVGSGALVLTATNTYTGGSVVNEGILRGSTTSLQGGIVNNATVDFTQTSSGTYAGGLSGTGNVQIHANSATVTFSGINTYTGGTTVVTGILQGTTNSLQGNIANNQLVIFNQNFNGSYNGSITGDGSVIINSESVIVTFNGGNSYLGDTIIQLGALQGNSTTLSGNSNITNNSSLLFNQTVDGAFAPIISGTGSVTKFNLATLTLTGTNTYTGGTTVNLGALQGTTDSLQGTITNQGAVNFNQTVDGTYAGSMSGSGSVHLLSTNTAEITFTGTNTYSGGTFIEAGALKGTTTSLQGNITDNTSLIFSQTADGTFIGSISGAGSVTLDSSNTTTITFAGSNTYTGGTSVLGGVLQGATNSLQGNIEIQIPAVLNFNQGFNGTMSGVISGNGTVVLDGSNTGVVEFTGTNTYTGGTQILGGALQASVGSLPIDGAILNNAQLIFNQSSNATFTGIISGSGSVNKTNSGTLILTGIDTYLAGTTITSGTLQVLADTGLGNANGSVTFNGGALQLGGSFSSARAMNLLAGAIIDTNGFNLTSSGVIGGSSSLTKIGLGVLTLTGVNTYSGGTHLNAGTINIAASAGLGNTSGSVTFNGATLQAGASFALAQPLVLGTSDALIDTNSFVLTLSNTISGNHALTKLSTGTLTLTASNTYTGGTNVNGGVLIVNQDASLGSGALNINGASFQIGNGFTTSRLLTLTGSSAINTGSFTLGLSGTISGTGLLTKLGSGTLILTGANTYSGGTTITAGVLQANTTSLQGIITNNALLVFDQATNGTFAGSIFGSGSVTKQNTGTLILSGVNSYLGGTNLSAGTLSTVAESALGASNGTLTIGSATWQAGASFTSTRPVALSGNSIIDATTFTLTVSGSVSGSGALSVQGQTGGKVILTGANTYTGGTTISSGTLQVASDANLGDTSGSITLLGGSLQAGSSFSSSRDVLINSASIINTNGFSLMLDGVISSGSNPTLTKAGNGTLILTHDNNFSGNINITAGSLQGNASSILGNVSGSSSTSVIFDQVINNTYAGNITGSISFVKNGIGTLIVTGSSTYSGGTTINAGALQGDVACLFGNINNLASLIFDIPTSQTFQGTITGSGSLTKQNTAVLTLNGTNTYTGSTNLNQGTLQISSDANLGNVSSTLNIGAATLKVGSSTSLTIARPIALLGAAIIDTNGKNLTLSGSISGAGGINKQSSGILILTGPSTYSGGTTIGAVANSILQGHANTVNPSLQGLITNNASLVFDQATSGSFDGTISGSGSVTKQNTGLLAITSPQTFTGGMYLTGGILNIASDIALGATSSIMHLSGGTLQAAANFTSASRTFIVEGPTTIDTQNFTVTISGTIDGSATLTKTGTGTLILIGSDIGIGGYQVTAGALQGSSQSLLGSINTTTNVSVIFDQSTSGTYTGSISGTGSVFKINTATLILSGSNTYSGGTTVSAGILQGTTASLQGDILNNAQINFSQSFAGTYSGIISGTGNLHILSTNTGTVKMVGANTYSGTTTIDGGTLEGNGAGLQSTLTSQILNNAMLNINEANACIFNRAIAGTGSITLNGIGSVTFQGNNTYQGLTKVLSGTLILDQSSGDSIPGNLLIAGGSVVLNQGGQFASTSNLSLQGGVFNLSSFNASVESLTFTGGSINSSGGILTITGSGTVLDLANTNLNIPLVIAGASVNIETNSPALMQNTIATGSSLTKTGSAALTLLGTNDWSSEDVSIQDGRLTIIGSLTANSLVVENGAFLNGIGTITSDATLQGTLQPGASIGTINLVGNQTFASGSLVEIEYDQNSTDLINITGNLTLEPGSTLSLVSIGSPAANTGQTYTFVQTSGAITGTFSSLITTLPPAVQTSLQYAPNSISYTFSIVPFNQIATSGNASQVADQLANANPTEGSDLSFVIEQIANLSTTGEIDSALNQMQPSMLKGLILVQESNAMRMRMMYNQRIDEIVTKTCNKTPIKKRKFTLWTDYLANYYSQDTLSNQASFHAGSGGAALGFDYENPNQYFLGMGGGYTYSNVHWNENAGNGDINSIYGAMYGGYFTSLFYFDLILEGSQNHYQASRHINFGNVRRSARSSFHGYELLAHADFGMLLHAKKWEFSPFISSEYIYLHQDAFREFGANSIDLRLKDTNYSMARGEVGLNFSHCFPLKRYKLKLGGKASYVHEERFQGKKFASEFVSTGSYFVVKGMKPNRNLFVPGMQLGLISYDNKIDTNLQYQGETNFGSYWDQNVSLQFSYRF